MNRKFGIFATTCWVTMVVSSLSARAQDTARVPNTNPQDASAVDALVHADVEEGANRQPQAPQQSHKQPARYSKWGFQSANHSPATKFVPTQAATAGLAGSPNGNSRSHFGGSSAQAETQTPGAADSVSGAASAGNSGKLDRRADIFTGLSASRLLDRSTGSDLFAMPLPLSSAQAELAGLSTASREKQFGGFSTSIPNPFPKASYSSSNRARTKARNHKPFPPKPGEHVGGITGASSDQLKKTGTLALLPAKPE
jgi:hypothetical protein